MKLVFNIDDMMTSGWCTLHREAEKELSVAADWSHTGTFDLL